MRSYFWHFKGLYVSASLHRRTTVPLTSGSLCTNSVKPTRHHSDPCVTPWDPGSWTKHHWGLLWPQTHLQPKFHENPSCSFCVIQLTNQQTKRTVVKTRFCNEQQAEELSTAAVLKSSRHPTHTHTHRLCYSFISLSSGLFLFLGVLHMSVFQNVPSWWFCWPSFCTVWRLGTVGTKQGGTKWLLTLVKCFWGGELVQQSCWLQHRRPQSVFYILRSKHLVFTLFCRTLRDFLSHCKAHIPPKDPIVCFISAVKHISQSRCRSQLRFRSLDQVSATKKRWGDSNINPHRPRQLIK